MLMCFQPAGARSCAPLRFVLALLAMLAGPIALVHASLPDWLAPITLTAEPFIGVKYYQITQSLAYPQPHVLQREISMHIVEIDPSAPGVSFFGQPGNGAAANEYTRMTTSSFVTNNRLAVGINGDFYTTNTGATADVNGLGMSNGQVVSPWGNSPSFVTMSDNMAAVVTNGVIPSNAWNAVSGNQHLLSNGINVTPIDSYTTTLNPHTAIGVDRDSGKVFFMVVDGRQGSFSQGMRTDEMADILMAFGVDDAINLDGGGSSTLSFGDGRGGTARPINSPSDSSSVASPGVERAVGNNFGIFATPNPAYVRLASPPRPNTSMLAPAHAVLTKIDEFEGGAGRFNSPVTGRGFATGITVASTSSLTTDEAQSGDSSQKLVIERDGTETGQLRHLSGGGTPAVNRVNTGDAFRAMGTTGFVGFFLKTTNAEVKVGLTVDDGLSGGAIGTEISTMLDVIADGKWHLYEWNLADADVWSNFSGGNGQIDGPNAFLDSIVFDMGAGTAGQALTFYLDTVAFNPSGSLAVLAVPEPAGLGLLVLGLAGVVRGRRRA